MQPKKLHIFKNLKIGETWSRNCYECCTKLMILAIFLLSVYISHHISKNEMRVDCKDLLLKEMTLSLERRQPVLDSYSAAVGFSMIHTVVDMSSHLVLFPCYKIKLYFFPFISITTHMPTVNVQESKKNQGKE